MRRTFLRVVLALFLVAVSFAGHAQVGVGPVGQTGSDPEVLADETVTSWLSTDVVALAELSRLDAETICETLPSLLAAPPPPSGTDVQLDDRQLRPTDDADLLRYTYAAEVPPNRLEVVEVLLSREGDAWRVERVGFQLPATTGRSWLNTPQAGFAFILLSLLFTLGAFRPTMVRRGLELGSKALREHRRLVVWTMVLGWSIVFFGFWTGSQLPDACEEAVILVLGGALEQVGATAALASGDIARTAAVIFYQNFAVVTLTVLFGSALLFGIPAYLVAGLSFFAQTTAFGVLGLGSGVGLLAIVILMILEFTAYFLIVAGGGMLVATLARGGFQALGVAYRKLFAMLPWAAALLLVGAWYEAILLLAF